MYNQIEFNIFSRNKYKQKAICIWSKFEPNTCTFSLIFYYGEFALLIILWLKFILDLIFKVEKIYWSKCILTLQKLRLGSPKEITLLTTYIFLNGK